MKTTRIAALLISVLMAISTLATPALATDKPHGSPEPKAPPAADWREDYAYNLGMQAYIFSYLWLAAWAGICRRAGRCRFAAARDSAGAADV